MDFKENNIECVIWRNNENTHILTCTKCNKELLILTEIPSREEVEQVFYATCPYCQGTSFAKKISGQPIYLPVEGLAMVDIITEGNKTTVKMEKNSG